MTADAGAVPRIYILLPVHNRKATTERFIGCLTAQTFANWHLVLIDDGSTDGTADMVRSQISDVTVIRGKGNWWWGGALHQGYRWLRQQNAKPDDIVLIINDDTEFAPDFLDAALHALKPRSLLLAGLYNLATHDFVEAGVHWNPWSLTFAGVKTETDINCFSTRGLFLRVGDMLEIGGFHPVLLPHYLSDYEYTIRARRKGYTLTVAPAVWLYYDEMLTGTHNENQMPLVRLLKASLSKKSTFNPIYWTSFVLLACPIRYIPIGLARVWWRCAWTVYASIKRDVRALRAQ